MPVSVRLVIKDKSLWCFTPYNAEFVEDLKNEIHPRSRSWHGDEKAWIIRFDSVPTLCDLLNEHFPLHGETWHTRWVQLLAASRKQEDQARRQREEEREQNEQNTQYEWGRTYRNGESFNWDDLFNRHYQEESGYARSERERERREREQQRGRYSYSTPPGPSPFGSFLSTYSTLFITESAPKQVVEAAYKALARMYHPDLNGGPDSEEKMKQINNAYDKIKKEKRW